MNVERLIGGQRPRRGRPDDEKAGLVRQLGKTKRFGQFVVLAKCKTHVHRDVNLVLILHFSLSQRRAAIEAPVHWLESSEHITRIKDLAQRTDFVRLVARVHRGVGVLPFTEHAQSHEILLLLHDLLSGVSAAFRLHFLRRQALAVFLLDLDFDRHAVAIPAGHIRCVKTRHQFRLDDDVLKDFVDRVTDVNVTVGVRRAVVQQPHQTAFCFRLGADRVVESFLDPLGHPFRLAGRHIATHREGRVGEIQSGLVVRLVGFSVHVRSMSGGNQEIAVPATAGNQRLRLQPRFTGLPRAQGRRRARKLCALKS